MGKSKKPRSSHLCLLILLIPFLVFACDGLGITAGQVTAAAGSGQSVEVNTLVSLDGSASIDSKGATLTYTWSFYVLPTASSLTDADITQGEQGSFTPDVEGTFIVKLTASNGTNSDIDTVSITVTPAVITADAGTDLTAVPNTIVTLDASGSAGTSLSYVWSFSSKPTASSLTDSDITQGPQGSFTPDAEGDFVLELTVTKGTSSDTDTVTVSVAANAVTADAGTDKASLPNNAVTLDASSSVGISLTYTWAFTSVPAGSSLTDADITQGAQGSFTPDAEGDFVLELTVANSFRSDTDSVTITVTAEAVSADAGSDRAVLPYAPVTLDAGNSVGNGMTYTWSFSSLPIGSELTDSDITQGAQGAFTPDMPGAYVFSLTVSNGFNTDTDSVEIWVDSAPRAIADQSSILTQINKTITLDASNSTDADLGVLSGETLSYSWDLGDGTTKTGAVVEHSYSVSDMYVVTLTVTDSMGLAHTETIYVIVDEPVNLVPIADAGSISVLESNSDQSLSFDGSDSSDPEGATLSYLWDFGDGTTSTEESPEHQYSIGGLYVVTLTVTDDMEQTDQVQIAVNNNQIPTAVAKIIDEGRELDAITVDTNYSLTFDGSKSSDQEGELASFDWDMGDGRSFNGESMNASYSAPGFYTLTLTVTDSEGCTASSSVDVTVNNQAPVAALPDNINTEWVDGGVELAFTSGLCADPEGTPLSFSWDFDSDGTEDSTEADPSYTFMASGSYKVRLTVSDGSLTDFAEQYVVIANVDVADSAAPEAVILIPEQDPLIEEAIGNFEMATQYTMYVLEGSPAVFNALRSYDPGGLQTGLDANAAMIYKWDFNTADSTTENKYTAIAGYTYTAPGAYTAECTITDDEGDTTGIQIAVKVLVPPNKYPTANAGMNQIVTLGYSMQGDEPVIDESATVHFDGSGSTDGDGSLVEYTWNFGDGSAEVTSSTASASHDYAEPGTYLVSLTVKDDGKVNPAGSDYLAKTDMDTMAVIVKNPYINTPPVADVGSQTVQVITGEPLDFDATGSFDPNGSLVSYSWDLTNGTVKNTSSFQYAFQTAGTYSTVLTVTDNDGAVSSMIRTVEVVDPPPIAFRLDLSYAGSEAFGPDAPLLLQIVDLSDSDWMTQSPEAEKTITNNGIYAIKITDLLNKYDEAKEYAFLVIHDVSGTGSHQGNYWGFYEEGATSGFGTSAATASFIENGRDTSYSMIFTDSNTAELSVTVW